MRAAEPLKRLALVVASLVVALVLCEVALRLTAYRPALADPAMYVANDHEYLPYRMRPHYQGYYMGRRVRLDAEGYRIVEPDASETRRPGLLAASEGERGRTVLLVGDSVVFGHGLSDDETPAAQLQRILERSGRPARVRNLAVSGYTTWNEWAALEEYAHLDEVDALVLVYLENDITFDHNQLRLTDGEFGNISAGWIHRLTQAVYRQVRLAYLVRNGVERIRQASAAQSPNAPPMAYASAATSQPRSPLDTPDVSADSTRSRPFRSSHRARHSPLDTPAFAHSLEALRRIQALCDRHGIAFQVGIYRDVTYYGRPADVLEYELRLADVLAEHGIAAFVLRSHVERLPESRARIAWNDPHPTAEAVELFAGDIARALARSF